MRSIRIVTRAGSDTLYRNALPRFGRLRPASIAVRARATAKVRLSMLGRPRPGAAFGTVSADALALLSAASMAVAVTL